MNQVFNFCAGPASLPREVIEQAQQELSNWQGLGLSVMEISHRSKEFIEIAQSSQEDLRELLSVPDDYEVLFCQGGARTQFSAVPMNLLEDHLKADYINSGYWSHSAIQEAKRYCRLQVVDVLDEIDGLRTTKPMCDWTLSEDSVYVHYCANETVDGLAIDETPIFGNRIVVADFSSTILSRPIDVSCFGIIYASAQKNVGPAGLTLIIVRKDLLERKTNKFLPSTLNYSNLAKNNSMFNTPPTFSWYLSGLVFKWLKLQGGLLEMSKRSQIKASLLYSSIDTSDFYYNSITPNSRSLMNVTFRIKQNELDNLFLKQSQDLGLYFLKGHRAVGGMRASLYNAVPVEGIYALVDFMREFARRYG